MWNVFHLNASYSAAAGFYLAISPATGQRLIQTPEPRVRVQIMPDDHHHEHHQTAGANGRLQTRPSVSVSLWVRLVYNLIAGPPIYFKNKTLDIPEFLPTRVLSPVPGLGHWPGQRGCHYTIHHHTITHFKVSNLCLQYEMVQTT